MLYYIVLYALIVFPKLAYKKIMKTLLLLDLMAKTFWKDSEGKASCLWETR